MTPSWVKATIHWSPPPRGRVPPGPTYSTPARFEKHKDRWPEEAWSVVAEFDGPVLADGSVRVRLRFLADEAPLELLTPDSRFDLFEGDTQVGSGVILEMEAQEMEEAAGKWSRDDLLALWSDIKAGKAVPGWDRRKAFAYLVVRAFDIEQGGVQWPDQEARGAIQFEGRTFLIESKDVSEPTTIEAVAELRSRLKSRQVATGVMVSVGDFEIHTEKFAQFLMPMDVLLWSGADLEIALRGRAMGEGLRQKLKYASERRMPLYSLEEI